MTTSTSILHSFPLKVEASRETTLPTISVADRLETFIKQIEARESAVQAWEYLDFPGARRRAAEIDRSAEELPLRGLVAAVKDIFDTDDMPTVCGSPINRGRVPAFDAAAVSLLRANGAVVLGKTVSTEFACSLPSRTRNPANLSFSPGGSSSGSAAVVAAGMADVALGSQTLGSVIRPASFCGVVGFKPSFGRISRAGVFSLSSSLDTVGILARDIASVRRTYWALSGDRSGDRADFSKFRPRLAVAGGSFFAKATLDARSAIDDFCDTLRRRGYELEDVEFSDDFEKLGRAARTIHDFEVGQRFISERRSRGYELSAHIHTILDRASKISPSAYQEAVMFGEAERARYSAALARHQGLLTLAAMGEAPLGNLSTGDPSFNTPWTFLHVPAVSLPLLHGCNRLPIGVQIIAPRFADNTLLDVAGHLETAGQDRT